MAALRKEPQSLRSLMLITGDTNRGRFKDNIIQHLIDGEIVEPTNADIPNSPNQRYTLTGKGVELLNKMSENEE